MTSTYKSIIQLHENSTASVFQIVVDDSIIFNLQRNEFTINQKKSELTDHFTREFDEIKRLKKNKKYCFNFMQITLGEDLKKFFIDFSAKAIDLIELAELMEIFFRFPFAIAKKTGDNPNFINKNSYLLPISRNDCLSPESDGRSSSCSLIYIKATDGDEVESLLLIPEKKTETETKKS